MPPGAPTGLNAVGGTTSVNLTWNANNELDLAGYRVYRSTSHAGTDHRHAAERLDPALAPAYSDTSATAGTTYHYVVTAVDFVDNQSLASVGGLGPGEQHGRNQAVQLNGSSQYVTLRRRAGAERHDLHARAVVPRTGAGVGVSTGSDGIASAIPLSRKGRAEAESPANLNMDYFLGIDASTGVLVADFEDTASAANHPVTGTTVVTRTSGITPPPSTTRRPTPGACTSTARSTARSRSAATSRRSPRASQHAARRQRADEQRHRSRLLRRHQVDEVRIWNVARNGRRSRRRAIRSSPPAPA